MKKETLCFCIRGRGKSKHGHAEESPKEGPLRPKSRRGGKSRGDASAPADGHAEANHDGGTTTGSNAAGGMAVVMMSTAHMAALDGGDGGGGSAHGGDGGG
ncbi:hypothetical protein L1049_014258 [Liquidambar formosana]|uniref:Uncharacterized protein n=1 Tax=Liquidambar formosana TaxID=63359 RepID=A0AAP0RQS5_LIQFO